MTVLEDVAKEAGVSISTASRALQDDRRISTDTKRKVEAAADRLGYTKHRTKGPGAPRDWNNVGIIVPEVLSGYYARLIHLANDCFAKQKYATSIRITNFDQETMTRYIHCFGRWTDVKCLLIIVDDSEEISDEIFTAVSAIRRPALFITSKYFSNLDFDSLYIDEQRGVAMALEYLVSRGYQRIGFIGEHQTLGRHRVYLQTMERLGVPVDPQYVKLSDVRAEEGGYRCMRALLREKDRPDAVFASYDQMAIGAVSAVEEAGLRIPEDIAIVGFDDMFVSRYIHRGLTTIQNPYEDMMAIAVRVLLNRVKDPSSAPQQIALRPTLIVRGTA